MRSSAKVFRIETITRPGAVTGAPLAGGDADARHREVMAAIGALTERLAPAEEISRQMVDSYRAELEQARALKGELDAVREAIESTKLEIATLHTSSFDGFQSARVTDELDAIVSGTEQATEAILAAAETVDERAGDLAAKLDGDDQGMAADIQEAVVRIFEACNFQDLTGQRITKIVATLRFVEERVDRMIEIWGGLDAFSEIEPDRPAAAEGDKALLNGPALPDDDSRASQDDIDALFA